MRLAGIRLRFRSHTSKHQRHNSLIKKAVHTRSRFPGILKKDVYSPLRSVSAKRWSQSFNIVFGTVDRNRYYFGSSRLVHRRRALEFLLVDSPYFPYTRNLTEKGRTIVVRLFLECPQLCLVPIFLDHTRSSFFAS